MPLSLQILLCVLVADLVTGIVHWWEDTYGVPSWPILGQAVIEPNILHHERPSQFVTMSNLLARNYQPAMLSLTALSCFWLSGWLAWQTALISILAGCGNEVHAWAHVRPKHWLPRLLQDMCLVQTPQHHARHHRRPYDTRFCSLTNLLNPLLDLLRFWRSLEVALSTLGIPPRRLSPERRGV